MGTQVDMSSVRGAAAALLAAWVGIAAAQDKALNPKDALAPVMRENPKLADPAADLARLRNEGIAHYEGGLTLDRAIVSFQTAYERARRPADAFNLALVYMRQGKPAEARPWVEKALDGNADFAAAQYLLGLIDKLEGKPEAARARFLKTNELQPLDAQLHYELAMLASAAKDQQLFLQELLRALQVDPEHKSSLYQMYRYYQSAGNKELAAASLKRFNAVKASERFTRKERLFDESSFTRPLHDDPQRATAGFPYLESALAAEVARPAAGCSLVRLERIVSIARICSACAPTAHCFASPIARPNRLASSTRRPRSCGSNGWTRRGRGWSRWVPPACGSRRRWTKRRSDSRRSTTSRRAGS
jgi:tetratricopeptide (TPR) repeat protein